MPNINAKFKISIEQPVNVLISYYTLIGVDSRDEYGWICEYSAFGRPPKRRSAVIEILGEPELLINLLDFPNTVTQLYAADGLIYNDFQTKKRIKNTKDKEYRKKLEAELISEDVWKKIYEIRDRNETVNTCGNMGSYKIYTSYTAELLSKKSIKEIRKNYKMLGKLGYL